MKLQLTKPLVFLDIEATGLDLENDRIVELSLCKLHPDGTREVKTYRYNPGIPIPAEATEIHGITDEDVKDKPLFSQHAKGILAFIEGCDLAGFNSNRFDLPMLSNELARCGQYFDHRKANLVDIGNIFKIKEPRTLEAGVKFYCDREHAGAHGAEADVLATIDVFEKQLEKYEGLPTDLKELALFSNYDSPILDLAGKFTSTKEGVILLNFGKYKGLPAADHLDFLDWMVYKASFTRDKVEIALSILNPDNDEN
jgi:DNA polymerase-3 subunit epsilon